MARDGPVRGFHRARCDHDFSRQEMLATHMPACSRYNNRLSCSQAGHQFTLECPAPLDVQRLVYGLVRDLHRPIMRNRPSVGWRSVQVSRHTPSAGPDVVHGVYHYLGFVGLRRQSHSGRRYDQQGAPGHSSSADIARHFGGLWACGTAFSVPLSG